MQGSTNKMLGHLSTGQQAQQASNPDVKAAAGAAPIAKEKGWLSPPADEEVGKNLSPTASSGTPLAATALPIAASSQQVQLTSISDVKATADAAPIAKEKGWPSPPPNEEIGKDLFSPTASSGKSSAAASIAANAAGKIDSKTDAKYEMFSYENIIKGFQALPDGAWASLHRGNFIEFGSIANRPKEKHGWKFHIALSEEKNDVAKGWNAINNILIEYQVILTKVVKPNIKLASTDRDQIGKQITIYSLFNPQLPWETILNKMESKLIAAGVIPGKFSPGDKPVAGSRYFSYRNDCNFTNNTYLRVFEAMEKNPQVPFNPYIKDDPYKNISIQQAPMQSAAAETAAAGGSAAATTAMTTASIGLSLQR